MSAASRPRGRPFAPGQSGNPAGKAKGTRHRVTVALEKLMEADAKTIVAAVLTAAKTGDMAAARMVLDRLIPPTRERPVSIALPSTTTSGGVAEAQGAIVAAVAGGHLLPGEGAALSALVEAQRRAIETNDLERRLSAIEAKAKP